MSKREQARQDRGLVSAKEVGDGGNEERKDRRRVGITERERERENELGKGLTGKKKRKGKGV